MEVGSGSLYYRNEHPVLRRSGELFSYPSGAYPMNWYSKAGKSGLAKMLMREHHLSKRKAEKAVNAVFACMIGALRRGERVEIPVGWIQMVSPPAMRKKRTVQRFRNIQSGEVFFRIAAYGDRMIRFRPDPKLIERGPWPPPPLSPELERKGEEFEQLFSNLTGREITPLEFKQLLAAADQNLDRLLARLRELVKEGRTFRNFLILCATVRQLYWIR
jgi:nucleoid DNA-binding protein